jgi:enolase-phosphatase E1
LAISAPQFGYPHLALMRQTPPAAILTDIEGTTTPISFVHTVLFPYARARLAQFCAAHEGDPALDEVARLNPGRPVLETLLAWMDQDAKITPLKTIQGLIWAQGYRAGDLIGNLYPDVAPALRRWSKAGLRLYVYSSGSEAAQKLLFGHTEGGDLTPLFNGFFDSRIGHKREPQSYRSICRGANVAAAECLFLSDIEAELDAAAACGLQTCQLLRKPDGTIASARHPIANDFDTVAEKFRLPRSAPSVS